MSRSVHIREVGIHRVPGIRRGEGFKLDDLSPSVNIIFGPNGAGKSTTCRVIQELLWPGRLPRPSVEGVIDEGECEWRIDIDAGHPQSLRDGRSAVPDFGPAESRPRYHLGLKEFIIDDNADFARRIAEASQGGYDLVAAANVLNYSSRPTGPRSLHQQLQQCESAVQEAHSAQRQIDRDASRLSLLETQRNRAAEAEVELERLRQVKAYREAVVRCKEIEAQRDAFPDGVGRLRGDEPERLEELAQKEQRLTEQLAAEKTRLREAETQLEELDLPEDGIPDALVSSVRARKEALRDLEGRIAEQRRRRDEALGAVDEALDIVGETFSEEQLAALARIDQPDLSAFARKADRVRAERAAIDERRRWLETEESDEAASVEEGALQNGIHALASWLAEAGQSDDEAAGSSTRLISASMLLLVLAVALGVLQLWIWMAMAAGGLLLVAVEMWGRRGRAPATSGRDAHRKAYQSLSLPDPQSWDADGIAKHLRELTRLSGLKALSGERRARLKALQEDEQVLSRKEQELNERRAELAEQFACTIEIDDEWLPVLVDRISDWQSAAASKQSADEALGQLEQERDRLLAAIREAVEAFSELTIDSAAAAEQCIADLDRRKQGHASARKTAADARRLIDETIQPHLDDVTDERSALFERLEIDADRAAVIADWMARRQDFLECKELLAREVTLRDDKKTSLGGHEELLDLDDVELGRRIEEAASAAAERDGLSKQIGGIEQSIRDAKAGHALGDALAARDAARDALAKVREENGRLRVGAALTDWVRQVAVDRSRPQVFQRADELFVRFTRGTLQLQMDDRSSPPAFLARRGRLAPQGLNELSDGERVQLMTAVRLAFLEQDESKPLPLLIDEVLGTSDDGRSEVMIDTIIDVAKQGRQVFYCTAQHDEVGKWIARLQEEGIDFKLHDLAKIRELASARTNPLEIVPIETSKPPSPDGHTYDSYGRELGVPGIDPRAETIDGVHLWHLFDDADLLYQLLLKDISTWGQLETLLEHNGAGLIAAGDGTFEGARAAARALEAACAAWRIGRGQRVDRAALLDSGCVSETFIDKVTELAAQLDGEAEEVIKGLERGEVSGFFKSKIEDLRDFFETEAYLPLESPLAPEEIRVRMMAVVANELQTGMLDEDLLERMMGALPPPSD